MIAILNGETRHVLRHRRGVMWCPFCDRSTQDEGIDRWCEACHAKFEDEIAETETPVTPRRRRRATATSEVDESEDVDDEAADVL